MLFRYLITIIISNTATSKQEATKAKKLIEGTLCINVTRDITSSEDRVEAVSEAQGTSNSASPAVISSKPSQSVSATDKVVNLIDHELHIVEEPPKKKAKVINLEGIIMGEQLTDIEINVAQSLLKKQFPKLNGLASTLYQEKKFELSEASVQNKLQTIHWRSRRNSKLCSWGG